VADALTIRLQGLGPSGLGQSIKVNQFVSDKITNHRYHRYHFIRRPGPEKQSLQVITKTERPGYSKINLRPLLRPRYHSSLQSGVSDKYKTTMSAHCL